jgi:glucose/arabinose dehydrogenase
MAFHPRYKRNHLFYVNYTDRSGDTHVVEYRAGSGGARRVRQLLFVDQPYDNHNGGQLEFGPDGLLYVGMGDGGSGGDPENRGQNLSTRLAKLLRINVNRRGARWQIISYGLRNPWRFSFDRLTHDLWIADVGQNRFEEVDFRRHSLLNRLANYGWSRYEGFASFKSTTLNRRGQLVRPVTVYSHSDGCSITGGYVYRGSAVPAARGRYFYGDYCSGLVWSLRLVNGKASVRKEPMTIAGLSSFGEDNRGELYAVSLEGRIYKLAS